MLLFSMVMAVGMFTACDSHKHDFSKEVAEEEFIATEASCDQRATYYKSCSCGEKGTETFEYGDYKHYFGRGTVCERCGFAKPTQGLEYQLNSDKQSYRVKSLGTADSKEIVIASTYNDLPVTVIGEGAFSGKTSLTKLTIPDSITTIEKNAFRYTAMEIKWGKNPGLETIKSYAFASYAGTSITIPSGVKTIETNGFYQCTSLTSMYVPASLTTLEENAFTVACIANFYVEDIAAWCNISGLSCLMWDYYIPKNIYHNNKLITDLVIPDGATQVSDLAFTGNASITSVTIPDSVETIGTMAFFGSAKLKTAIIGNGVETIKAAAFSDCYELSSVTLGNNVKVIEEQAFLYCAKLGKMVLGDSVTFLGDRAFVGCTKLAKITLSKNIENIFIYTFADCKSLESIVIPNKVKSIGMSAFSGCDALTSITFENTEGWWASEDETATSGDAIDVSDPSKNAINLRGTYKNHYLGCDKN